MLQGQWWLLLPEQILADWVSVLKDSYSDPSSCCIMGYGQKVLLDWSNQWEVLVWARVISRGVLRFGLERDCWLKPLPIFEGSFWQERYLFLGNFLPFCKIFGCSPCKRLKIFGKMDPWFRMFFVKNVIRVISCEKGTHKSGTSPYGLIHVSTPPGLGVIYVNVSNGCIIILHITLYSNPNVKVKKWTGDTYWTGNKKCLDLGWLFDLKVIKLTEKREYHFWQHFAVSAM